MKIAILHSGDLEKISPGGISQYIEKIIKYNDGNEISLFGVVEEKSNYIIGKQYTKYLDGKEYKFIPIQTNNRKPLSLYYFFNIFKYFNLLDKYNVIYAQRMEYAIPFTFSKKRKKMMMAVHGSGKYSYIFWGKLIGEIYNLVESIAIRNCNKVIILLKREEFGLPYYMNKFSLYKNKFRYGKVPIDLDAFKKLNKIKVREKLEFNDNDNILIYFGRLDNNPKRVLLIPKILENVKLEIENIKCIVIGDGEDKQRLKDISKEIGVENEIIIYDKLNHGEVLNELINSADLSLILSDFEGICMSALESLVCGVPVIATDVGDVNEYISKNMNGIIIENEKDNKVIENASREITNFFNNKEKIKKDDIYLEYSGEIVMKELSNIFNEVNYSE